MKECHKIYQLMGLSIAIESQMPIALVDSFDAFETKLDGREPDLTIRLIRAAEMDLNGFHRVKQVNGKICYTIYESNQERRKLSYEKRDPSVLHWCVCQKFDCPRQCEIRIFPAWEAQLSQLDPFLLLGLPEFLAEYHALLLHASVIRQENRGILFTAPSGTGKSTQAALWENYHQAEVLNGDRALIRKQDTDYRVYGSPYAGSSYIYKEESAPLSAIIVLRQAKKNCLTQLSGKNAFLHLSSQLLLCRELPTVMNRQLDDLLNLMEQVPVYLLECLPDKEATDLVYQTLQKENKNGC